MPFITWLRSVNPDWNLVPANVLFAERSEKSGAEDVHLTPSQKLGVLPQAEYVERTGAQVVRNRTGAENMKHVEPGDFISHLRSFQGGLEYSALAGKVSNAYTVITPRVDLVDGYYRYLFKSSLFIEGLGNITDQLRDGQTINFARFSQFGLPLPPLETQRAIADYLARETAEIDAMSADLDEMEALLTERRSTSISQHLQSGSWPVAPIATMAEVTLGKMVQPKQKDPTDTEAPYLRAAHVPAPGTLNLDVAPKSMWFTPGELDHLTLRTGDVVIVEGGAGYGRAALVSTDLDGWGFQNSIIRVRAHGETAIGKFITYALLHAQSKGAIELLVSTATLPHFTAEKVERFRLPFPPIDEQRRIANEIDRETAEIDSMLADITELRDLLAERRAAIIAAAVTGQIDIPIHEEATHA